MKLDHNMNFLDYCIDNIPDTLYQVVNRDVIISLQSFIKRINSRFEVAACGVILDMHENYKHHTYDVLLSIEGDLGYTNIDQVGIKLLEDERIIFFQEVYLTEMERHINKYQDNPACHFSNAVIVGCESIVTKVAQHCYDHKNNIPRRLLCETFDNKRVNKILGEGPLRGNLLLEDFTIVYASKSIKTKCR